MRVHRVLVVLLLATAIVAVSGCMEFGAIPDAPPAPAPTASPTATIVPTPTVQVPDTQVSVTLKNVSTNQTADMRQAENLVLTIENTGTTSVANLCVNYAAEDPVAAERLNSGSVSVGSLDAGCKTDVTVSLPGYDYLHSITFSVTAYWGDNPEHVNDKARPWSISLVTNQFWEK